MVLGTGNDLVAPPYFDVVIDGAVDVSATFVVDRDRPDPYSALAFHCALTR